MPSVLPSRYNRRNDLSVRRFGFRRPGATFPDGPTVGDTFWKSDTETLHSWDGSSWVQVFPAPATTFGATTTGGTTSGTTELNLFTINIPAQPRTYFLHMNTLVTVNQSTGTERFDLRYTLDAGAYFRAFRIGHTTTTQHSESFFTSGGPLSAAAHTLTVGIARVAGAGTISVAGSDARFGACHAWVNFI